MNLGAPEVLLLTVVWLALVVPPVWALVDAVGRPQAAFDAIGRSRATWIILLLLGILCFALLGLVLGLYYLLSVRPKLQVSSPSGP